MKMEGQQLIPASQDKVWEALNDPETLKLSIPGCDTVEKTSDTEFQAALTAKFGPVKAKFKGKVTLSDIDAPNGYTLAGEGKGGAAGFGKGEAKVSLETQENGTLLTYSVNAKVGGKLAQIGSRLVDSAAKKMADDFFKAFSENVKQVEPEDTISTDSTDEHQAVSAEEASAPASETKSNYAYWGIAAALILAALYAFS